MVKALGNQGSPLLLGDFLGEYSFMLEHGTVDITTEMSDFLGLVEEATKTLVDKASQLSIADISSYIQSFKEANLGKGDEMPANFDCPSTTATQLLKESSKGTLCDEDPDSSCCMLEKAIRENLGTVFRMMKYGERIESRELARLARKKDLEEAMALFDLPLIRSEMDTNSDPLLFACKFGALSVPLSKNCSIFSPFYTTKSIGVTFNSMDFWNLYRTTKSNEAFFEEMHEKINETGDRRKEPYKSEFSGPGKHTN